MNVVKTVRIVIGKQMNDQNAKLRHICCFQIPNTARLSVWVVVLVICYAPLSWAAPQIVGKPVITGLTNPIAITNAGDGSARLFIALQNGRIIIHDGTRVLSPPFLDIASLISSGGEQGLLGVAFHPNYAANGFFFVNYTNRLGNTVIARYSVSADPNIADPNSAVQLLTIAQPFSNHNGGQLQFGPDGYLYIGMGDGGSGGDPQNNAQNLTTLLGKILRIDVDRGLPYAIPPDNPFRGTPGARNEIWSLGLRNPWQFSFDRLTGDLFIGDVGQRNWEEIDFQPANSSGGENYGWRLMEGNHCFNPLSGCNSGGLTLPIIEYNHSVGCSITGGYRYRGTENQGLEGIYIYGDFCTGRIWGAIEDNSGGWMTTELLNTSFLISAFGEDENGEIYFAHYSDSDGAIFQIVEDNRHLSYAPVTSCRIVDTRKSGGAIPPGGVRNYNVRGTVASQGGNPAGCPSPKGEPHAVHINVTAVPSGNGNILAYPFFSSAPTTSLVNYRSDAQNIANSATVKTCFNCTKDISIKSNFGTAHVVIDVLGYYFSAP